MSSACAEAFLKEYSEELPQKLLSRYDPIELLSQNGHCKTYLLRAKSDGSLAVAKAYRQSDVPVKEDIFSKLSHPGLPAYLESSSPANVPLYRRHGFEVVEVLKATPDAPEMWAMWREARAPE